ncbi:MAG: redoxin domain-containing protein [Caldithrix sp.]|nr:redoxin domain-containing protein [Caldithrix sp.]
MNLKTIRLAFTAMVFALMFSHIDASSMQKSIYQFTMENIDGKPVSLDTYEGKVILVVNVASKCGFTNQYEGLQKLFETYMDKGFVVLGFPANNFANQEPGDNSEIKQFCQTEYGVTFPMFSKISVKGSDIHPLYQYLTSDKTNKNYAGEITWNFNKFLINKEGQVINRFDSRDKPQSDKIVKAIEKAL